MSTDARIATLDHDFDASAPGVFRSARYAAGVLALALAYYASAKIGQSLRYTASVSAVWPPAGVGIAALYLFGLRWWPGIFLGELAINSELVLGNNSLPIGSIFGQQLGNMAEIVVGAMLLRRLIGRRAALERSNEVAGMLVAVGCATAISATVGTISLRAGGALTTDELGSFWRTWWLGDTAGALVALPLALAWSKDPRLAFRRLATAEGVLLICAVGGLAILGVSSAKPLTYIVFPALIWAAFRFGPTGATLSIALLALLTIGITADDLGLFSKQPISDRTLGTQLYIIIAASTTLFIAAVVTERERGARLLAEARRHEGERALEERRRIARDLHDSVSQALFSALLETRAAQRERDRDDRRAPGPVDRALASVGELIRSAQTEMRALIFELGRNPVESGLVPALTELAGTVGNREALAVGVRSPSGPLDISDHAQAELYAVAREALANVVKHAGAREVWIDVVRTPRGVSLAVADDGRGFDTDEERAGHFGLASMRSRAAEIGGVLTIISGPGRGTTVLVEVARGEGDANGG